MLGAARSWAPSDDGLRHRFRLRPSCRWTDGKRVTAGEFVESFRRVALSPSASLISLVEGAEGVTAGQLAPEQLGVTALSDDELAIELDEPVPYLPALLAAIQLSPVHGGAPSEATNGPYALDSGGTSSEAICLRPNAYYSGRTPTARLRFQIDESLHRPLERYASGDLQITCHTWFPFDQVEVWGSDPGFHRRPSAILFCVAASQASVPAFKVKDVRRRLASTLDRAAIAECLHGGVTPWTRLLPEPFWNELATAGASEIQNGDPGRGAAQELPLRNSLIYADYYPNGEIAALVAEQWARSGLASLRLEPLAFAEFVARVEAGNFELALQLFAPAFADPAASLIPLAALLDGAEFDACAGHLLAAQASTGEARRRALLAAHSVLEESIPVIPVANGQSLWLQHPRVRGYEPYPEGGACFAGLCFE